MLSTLRAWLLHDYIVPYCRSLANTRIYPRCFLIDGLGSVGSVGSTLQSLAEVSQVLERESKMMSLRGFVLQPGKSHKKRGSARQVKAASEPVEMPFTLPEESSLINADWSTIASELLPALDQSAAIFLLNPFEAALSPTSEKRDISFLTYNDLAPLYTRTAPTELCLLIAHAQVEHRLLPSLQTPAGAAAFTALLRSDRWKATIERQGTSALVGDSIDIVEGLIGLLQSSMQPHFLAVQRVAFPQRAAPSSLAGSTLQSTLLFATRRQDSLLCMNDAICAYRRRSEEQSYTGTLHEAWFAEQHLARQAEALQVLREHTLQLGRAQSPRRWPDLRQRLLLSHFGDYLLREYDEVICKLLESGEAYCEWRQAATSDGRHAPGNEDVLLWQKGKRRY